jgi:hypothetical protein
MTSNLEKSTTQTVVKITSIIHNIEMLSYAKHNFAQQ